MSEPSVGTLLTASMQAHQQAWEQRRAKQYEAAKASMQTAYDLRSQAHALDPEHRDPIWTAPVMDGPLKGVHLHESLMTFYRQQLGL